VQPGRAAGTLRRLGLAEVSLDRTQAGANGAAEAASALLGTAQPEAVVAALVADGVPIRQFTVDRPALEDVFVSLTGEGFNVSG
jgi:ABC-2 type transport system ATP-binding protein